MSLLMDALKKAEQEKREAARKLEEPSIASTPEAAAPDARTEDASAQQFFDGEAGAPVPGPAELSLEPVSGEFAAPPVAEETGLPPEGSPATGELPTLNITGDRLYSLELNTSQPQVTPPPKPIQSGLEGELIDEQDFDGDKTFQGIPGDVAPRAVPGMFEETVQGDVAGPGEIAASDQTLPGVSAAQLTRDIGTRDQPTPVAAETVFVAGRARDESAPTLKWVLGGLTLLMLAATGIWVYFTVTPVARSVPSPWVARGIETVPAPRADLALPVAGGAEMPGAVPVEGVIAETSGSIAAPAEPTAQTQGPTEVPAEPVATTAAPAESVEPAAPAPGPETEPASAPVPATAPAAPAVAASATATPVAVTTASPSLVRISRSQGPSNEDRRVREAYDLYQAGDMAGARAAYLEVLAGSPDNIDALLGIGAIALRLGETAKAVEAHGRVLRLDPDNKTALAVLVGMNKSADLNGAESAVKTLIQESPDQAFLYFTLGGIHAAQQRWPEAQQAFFDAHRTDSSNPDYALNLAVSLDRIGQKQSALDYYNTALKLGEQRPAGFDPSAILARIQALAADATR